MLHVFSEEDLYEVSSGECLDPFGIVISSLLFSCSDVNQCLILTDNS